MKKKIVTLLLVAAMTGTMVVGCGSKADDKTSDTKTEQTDDKKDTEEKKELADDEYQYVSAADTVSADGVHVLDVREWENYSKGRVANSEWCPIFPLEDDSLVDEMTTYAKDHLNDGKDIYLICNSGKRGAEKATGVLRDAQVLPGRAVCFSVSNISFFAFSNKGFVVSFFRNLALRNFLSAKSLNLRGCFGQIAFVCNFFDIFQSFSGTKIEDPLKNRACFFLAFPL